jgi:hypothetical protein
MRWCRDREYSLHLIKAIALFSTFTLIKSSSSVRDNIIVENLTYPGFIQAAQTLNVNLISISTNYDTGIDLEELETKGIRLTKKYTMESSLLEMKGEYETHLEEREKKNSIKFQQKLLMTAIRCFPSRMS